MECPADIKGKYLLTYGLLQALFLQQDETDEYFENYEQNILSDNNNDNGNE
jgi:hypothetical protein